MRRVIEQARHACGAADGRLSIEERPGVSERDFTAFFEGEYSPLVGALTLWCGQREVAEEVVQDAFARAYRDWRRVSALDKPAAWVRRVAINLATSRFRRWQAERRATRRLAGHPQDETHPDSDPSSALVLREALSRITPAQRTVLVLRYYLNLPVEDVAEITSRSPSAVTSLTQRAIAGLQDLLDVDDASVQEGLRHD
jgi:RNA polymerase sigma-70 factor (sigma-E family)